MAQQRLPKPVQDFRKRYPNVWSAFNELGDRCHSAGPLAEKTSRLVKVALSMGAGLEGATHSAVRNARKAGITPDEIMLPCWLLVPSDCPRLFALIQGPAIDLAASSPSSRGTRNAAGHMDPTSNPLTVLARFHRFIPSACVPVP